MALPLTQFDPDTPAGLLRPPPPPLPLPRPEATGRASSEPLQDEPEEEEEEEAAEEEEDSEPEPDEDELGADETPARPAALPAPARVAAVAAAAPAAPAARDLFSFEPLLPFGAADFRRGLARGLRALALMPRDRSSSSSSEEETADPDSLVFPLGALVPGCVACVRGRHT